MAGFWSGNPETGNGQYLDPAHGGATSYDPNVTSRGGINPETLAAIQQMGFTGDPFSDTAETNGEYGQGSSSQLSPEFISWMQQNGITPSLYQGGGNGNDDSTTLTFTGPNGPIGTPTVISGMNGNSMMAAAALGIGGFGATAMGAFGAGASPMGGAETGAIGYTPYTGPGSEGFAVAGDNAVAPAGWGEAGSAASGAPVNGLSGMDLAADGGMNSVTNASKMFAGGSSGLIPGISNSQLLGLGGSALQSLGSFGAASAATNATNQANATQAAQYQQNRTDWAPYRETGYNALGKINGLMQNPSSITSDPGYQFGLNQGQTAIDRSAASKGQVYSGATLKALQRYGTDYSGTKLDQTIGRYGNIAQLGATGVAGTANSGTNAANQISNNQMSNGTAQVGNALNQGNVWGNALNQIGAYGERKTWGMGP